MRGHVHHMTDGWSQRGQHTHVRQGLLRAGRCFDSMKIIVDRSKVTRVAFQYRFQHRKDLRCVFSWRSIVVPQSRRAEVHHGLGVKRGRIEVIRIAFHQIAHGILEFDCQLLALWIWAVTVPLAQCVNVGALDLGRICR